MKLKCFDTHATHSAEYGCWFMQGFIFFPCTFVPKQNYFSSPVLFCLFISDSERSLVCDSINSGVVHATVPLRGHAHVTYRYEDFTCASVCGQYLDTGDTNAQV